MELYRRGLVSSEDIDDYVSQWHEEEEGKNPPIPLYEYLGMTETEYIEWVSTANLPPVKV